MSNNIKDISLMFVDLATKHEQIGIDNFGRTLEEYQSKSRSMESYLMIMEPIISRLHGQNEAQLYRTFSVGFTIAKHWSPGEFDEQWTIIGACEEILLQMLARIRYYAASYNLNLPEIWQSFDATTVRIEPIYFDGDQFVGASANFELTSHQSLAFDTTDADGKWNDLP